MDVARLPGPGGEEPEDLFALVEAEDGRVVRPDEPARLLGSPGEERLEILKGGGLEAQVVESRHLAGDMLGRGLAVGSAQRQGEMAAEGGEEGWSPPRRREPRSPG